MHSVVTPDSAAADYVNSHTHCKEITIVFLLWISAGNKNAGVRTKKNIEFRLIAN